jgi:hypothetical protein
LFLEIRPEKTTHSIKTFVSTFFLTYFIESAVLFNNLVMPDEYSLAVYAERQHSIDERLTLWMVVRGGENLQVKAQT